MSGLTLLQPLGFEVVRAFDETGLAPIAVGIAAVVGAAHGLAPGHGKTLAAAYLLSARAGRRHAVALAAIVAGMHTASVLALAMVWWATVGDDPMPVRSVTQGAQFASALLVLAVGVVMTRRRWKERPSRHHHDGHFDPHAPDQPWSWSGLAGIASAGGLVPSPSAFLVLVSGLLTGRVVLALAMVGAFGLGLGATVLATGLLTLAGRRWLTGRQPSGHGRLGRVARLLPLVGAGVVVVGGLVLCVMAVYDVVAGA